MSKDKISYTSKICKHISRVLGNDKRRSLIIDEVQTWYVKSGPQWTVERLRSLREAVIHYISSQESQIRKTFSIPQSKCWIKTDAQGWPKGPLGRYIKDTLLHSKDKVLDKKISKVMSILHVSKVIKSEKILPVQRKKYIEAISGKPGRDDLYDYSYSRGKQALNIIKNLKSMKRTFLNSWVINHEFSFAALNTSKTLASFIPKSIKKTPENQWILSLLEVTNQNSPLSEILKGMGCPVNPNPTSELMFAGVIKVLQEGNLKARVVAMPNAGAQIAFRPLHKALCSVLKEIPQDCTFNQMKGVQWGAEQLRQGKTMYAVDLSSATDNFPLGFQIAVLEGLDYVYAKNFKDFCQLPWGYKDSAFSQVVRYTKGQPMGLYGSFTLFSLSHHILLQAIESKLKLDDTYRILGDDIIINNEQVYKAYSSVMREFHVPISIQKCLISDFYTEFAGKLISPNGKIPIVKGPKGLLAYGHLDPNQFLNYCEVTGKVDELMRSIPKQYHNYAKCLVALPEYFGGLGLNPNNEDWLRRISKFNSVLKQKGYPEFKDLRTSILELKMVSSSNHVSDTLSFINEQLIKIENNILRTLQSSNTAFYGMAKNNHNLMRVLLQQAVEAQGLDGSLSYVGSLSGKVDISDSRKTWRNRANSISQQVNQRFDALSKEYSDLSKVNNKKLSEPFSSYTPWM